MNVLIILILVTSTMCTLIKVITLSTLNTYIIPNKAGKNKYKFKHSFCIVTFYS